MTNEDERTMNVVWGTKDLSFGGSHCVLRGTFSSSRHLAHLPLFYPDSARPHTSSPKYSQVFSFNIIFVFNPHEG